ncbi:MAG: hypothetical protein R6V10_11280 [bacterium]
MFRFTGVLVLAAAFCVSACKTPEEKKEESDKSEPAVSRTSGDTARKAPRKEDKEVASAPKPSARALQQRGESEETLSPEEYWEIQLKRRQLVVKYLEKRLSAYQELTDKPEELKDRLQRISMDQRDEMQSVWNEYDIMPHRFYPRGENASEVKTQRQNYLKDHPELSEKQRELSEKMSRLRQELREKRGGPGHGQDKRRGLPKMRRPPTAPQQAEPAPAPGSTGE